MSKGLEALKSIKNVEIELGNNHNTATKVFEIDCEYVEAFNIVEKELKALEIVKKKNFDLFYLQDSIDLEMYNDACDIHRNLCYLTQEEYNLLKEVLL